uniref:Docking protein 4 n=1 Tax=Leptobrachium leishanense TaxID=445787 RepID=A0A8C5QQC9_9ANUR
MASDCGDILRQGYVRMKSRKLGIYRRCWLVLRKSSSKGPWRLEKYPDERSVQLRASPKVTEISNVKCIMRLPKETKRQAVAIIFCDELARTFTCDSELDADEWYKVLSVECPGARTNDHTLGEPDLLTPGVQSEQTERFSVFMLPSSHLDVYGECKMQITDENLYLWDAHNPRSKLLSWPLCALRRYGNDVSRFTFESERVCGITEGLYTFQTLEGQQIYERVHQAVLALAEQHKTLLLEMEKNARRLNKEGENLPSPGASLPAALNPWIGIYHTRFPLHVQGFHKGRRSFRCSIG